MSHSAKGPAAASPGEQVRRAVEEAAPDLGFHLEGASSSAEETRMVGALVPAAHSTTDVDTTEVPETLDDGDESAIQDVITQWENVEHHQVLEVARDVTLDPYVAVTPDHIEMIDSDKLGEWVGSERFAELKAKFPAAEEREVEISNLQIFFMGGRMATATYQTREEGPKGVYVTNTTAILIKKTEGWRIGVVTKFAEVQ